MSLDKLIGYYVSGYTAPHGLNLKGRGADREASGSLRPGAVLELSAPPGGGKTGAVIGMALSARMIEEDTPEVLLIGELDWRCSQKLTSDTEGSVSEDRLQSGAESLGDAGELGDSSWPADKVDAMLGGIHVMRVGTQLQMISVLHMLDSWLTEHPKVCVQ